MKYKNVIWLFVLVSFVMFTQAHVDAVGPRDSNLESGSSSSGGSSDDDDEDDDDKDKVKITKSKYTPTGLRATAVQDRRIDLTWADHAKGENGYYVERQQNGGVWRGLVTLNKNTTFYSDRSIATGNTYTYRVRAYHGDDATSWSNVASATLKKPEVEKKIEEARESVSSNTTIGPKTTETVEASETTAEPQACSLKDLTKEEIRQLLAKHCTSYLETESPEQLAKNINVPEIIAQQKPKGWRAIAYNPLTRVAVDIVLAALVIGAILVRINRRS